MKEFPHHEYRIVDKLNQTTGLSTFVVKSHSDEEYSLVLKLYSGTAIRTSLKSLEANLSWLRGLVHPHLLGTTAAGISGKDSLFTIRQFSSDKLDFSHVNSTHIAQLISTVRFLHAHARPHGRLKPSNIFITDGTLRLADLQLLDVKEASSLDHIRFSAPEVLLGGPPAIESDYYSLGAILYRIYARRDPFDDSIPENLRAKYLQARIPSVRELSEIREPLAKAIDGLLHRTPTRRISAFRELLSELPFEADPPIRVPMVGRRETIDLIQSQLSSSARTLTVCLIEGDAGMGKSRLIEELKFKSNFHRCEFSICTCIDQNERGLAPIVRLLRTILQYKCRVNRASVRQLLGSFEDNLAPIFDESSKGIQAQGVDQPNERIVQDLIGLISALSRKEILKICIEDFDKADSATRNFLRQLCYRASELNVRLLLTCRKSAAAGLPGEIESLIGTAFIRTTLDPLARSESQELMRYLEPKAGNQRQILVRAGGNPFWLLEYSRNENTQAMTSVVNKLIGEETDTDFRKLIFALSANGGAASVELLARVVSLDAESVRQKLFPLKSIGAVRELNLIYSTRLEFLGSAVESELPIRVRRMIHGSLYGELATEKGASEERLAEHALCGGLWELASIHFSTLASAAVRRGDNVSALRLYAQLRKAIRQLGRDLPAEAESEIADCLVRTGKARKAELIFQRLLNSSDINEDLRIRLSLLSSGGEIDRSKLDQRLVFLREAIESSKSRQYHPSVLLSKLSSALATAGNLAGAEDALSRAKESIKTVEDEDGNPYVSGAEGFLLINKGHYQAAEKIYRTLPCSTWGMAAAALTNRSICLEHLGSIRLASVIQKRALRLASKSGHLVGQFLCIGNLGAFNTKLGNFQEARRLFEKLKMLAMELSPTTGISLKGVEAEEALLEYGEGRYVTATQHLRAALNSSSLLRGMRMQLRLLECEIHFILGVDVKASHMDQIAEEGAWSDSPLYAVQLSLLRSRTKLTVSESISILSSALEDAQKASLLYETCRLELEMADRLLASDLGASKVHVEEALRIARKNGYRPLQSRALLLRGMCSLHSKEKEHYLSQSLKLASNIGIPEIVSESSYQLGVLYESMDQQASSRDCIGTATRVIAEITEQIPVRFRSGYLARPWRNDARRRYEKQLHAQPIKQHVHEMDTPSGDNRYFRALYRVSIAAASARTVDGFLRELLPAMGLPGNSIVAMVTFEGRNVWYTHGVTQTDALRHRVMSLARKAGDQARFNSIDRWIPFRSLRYTGGICVLGRKRSLLGEKEMEFFTILGIFVSSALDQIHNRTLSLPRSTAHREFHGIVGNSPAVRELCDHIAKISNNGASVLIQGETGTGKELVARAIHKLSARSKGPFIPVDCGAIPEGLLESELFGSKRGSFTGATVDRPGVFEAANTGTLFLDEISNMNLAMQAKLLRVLQEREVRRVGETRNRPIDVRLIAASNTNLKQLVANGLFRQDLLFRLNVIGVTIPPLRARREDIPVLASHFLSHLNSAQRTSKVYGADAISPLLAHSFPGNIRELQNSVERAFFTASGQTISSIPIESTSGEESINEVRKWLDELAEGRRNFWSEIHDRYKRRDISREKVVALIDLGLRKTRGSYKNLASLLRIDEREYRRLMDFLRRNNCLLDFRPYRKVASLS